MPAKNIPLYPYCLCGGCAETIHVSTPTCPKCGYVKPPDTNLRDFVRIMILLMVLTISIAIYFRG
jgi:hypothetical protein